MPKLKSDLGQDYVFLDEYGSWLEEQERLKRLDGFRIKIPQNQMIDLDIKDFDPEEDLDKAFIKDLKEELENTLSRLDEAKKELHRLRDENIRLAEAADLLNFDNKHLLAENERLKHSLDAYDKIQIMDAKEIEHWKSTVEKIANLDENGKYRSKAMILGLAQEALVGVPE